MTPAAPGAAPDRPGLAADFVLGLAEGADRTEAERLVETDAVFAAEVAHWRARFAELDATAAILPVSDHVWPAILARLDQAERAALAETMAAHVEAGPVADDIAAEDDTRPSGTVLPFGGPRSPAGSDGRVSGRSGLWTSLAAWRSLGAAASLVAAVALAGWLGTAAPRPEVVAVLLIEPGKPGAVVEAFADGRVRLIPLQDLSVPDGRVLQVWTLQDRAQGPISVGLMPRARTLPLDLGRLPDPGPDQLFEITLEPAGGSPTGRPTGPILMKGLTSRTL